MVYQVNFELNNIRATIRTHPATVGDATRVLPLSHSPDHRHYTATELTQYAGMTAATMLARLKQMNDEYLIKVRAQSTHRYFTLADSNVAPALEALLCVVESVPVDATRWQRPNMYGLPRHARTGVAALVTLGCDITPLNTVVKMRAQSKILVRVLRHEWLKRRAIFAALKICHFGDARDLVRCTFKTYERTGPRPSPG